MARDPDQSDGVAVRVREAVQEFPQIDPLVEETVLRVAKIDRLIDKAAGFSLARVGLTHDELHVLFELQRGVRSHGDLTRELMTSTGVMTNRLDKLERAGLVRRMPDPADRRGVLLELTSGGRDTLNDYVDLAAARERELLGVLSVDEQQHLLALLRKLHAALHAELGPAPKRSPAGS